MKGQGVIRQGVIRLAHEGDEAFLLGLINAQDVKFWSARTRDVGPAEHALWLEHVLQSPDQHYVVVAEDGPLRKLGYGRLEFVTEARVSFAVAEEYRGAGIGKAILADLAAEAKDRKALLVAYVHPGNGPSMSAFISQGYHLDEMRTEKGVVWQILKRGS